MFLAFQNVKVQKYIQANFYWKPPLGFQNDNSFLYCIKRFTFSCEFQSISVHSGKHLLGTPVSFSE